MGPDVKENDVSDGSRALASMRFLTRKATCIMKMLYINSDLPAVPLL